jgi:GTP:adenosylcobinamide-phosphate guanylyltransferase
MRTTGFAGVVLAAQRAGQVDPLAAEVGLSHKCMVPVAGRPLIVHPLAALWSTPGLERLRIVVEPEMVRPLRAIVSAGPVAVEYVPAADNLADSVLAATKDLDQPTIVTTADNVLLTPDAVLEVLAALRADVDVAIAMARRDAVLAAHPDGQRRFYRFRDGEYSNCNLYGFAGARAFSAAESFRSGGQFAKKPMRLVAAVGVINVLLMVTHSLGLATALRRVGLRLGLRVAPVVLADGSHAIDVDNRRTYDVAAQLLVQRFPGRRLTGAA